MKLKSIDRPVAVATAAKQTAVVGKMEIGRGDRATLDAATSFKTRKDHIKSSE